MNDRSLSVYEKKWIIVFIVNKLNLIHFFWFVYTFVNYKYKQGIIQKKSASGSRTLPCLLIFLKVLFWSENAKNDL